MASKSRTLKFDELYKLDDYFEPMAISVDDKNRRRELANLLTDAFLYFFSVFTVHHQHNSALNRALYEQLLSDRVSDAVSKVTGIDGYISNHIRKMAKEVVETTYKNATVAADENIDLILDELSTETSFSNRSPLLSTSLREESPDLPLISDDSRFEEDDDDGDDRDEKKGISKDYWLSFKRALNIANNEANTIMNYTDFLIAKERGYTQKTWLTMLDPKVRDTHEEVEGQTVGIDEVFKVGDSEMKFPHDLSFSPDPKEVINCRCAVEYK